MEQHQQRTTYVYAIARPFHPVHLWGLRGVCGAAVHTVHHRDLVAIVSTVAPTWAQVDPDDAAASAHSAVVGAVFAHSPTLPLPPATLRPSGRDVVELLRAGYDRYCDALDRLAGRVEVRVRVHPESAAPGQHPVGTARLAEAGATIAAVLGRLAVDHRGYGASAAGVLEDAFLVDIAGIDDFTRLARCLDGDVGSTRLELSGPAPPYSFAAAPTSGQVVVPGSTNPDS